MSDTNIDITIIIPAYNEEGAIGETIRKIIALNLPSYELLVINDGSTDSTAEVAEAAGARVISHPYNIGNGAAIKTGIRCSRGLVLVFMDGDGQHDPADIKRLISPISKYHMVVGARTKDSDTSLHRNIANSIFNSFASFIAQFDIKDLTSGFRVMRRPDALRFCDILPNTFSYPSTSTLAFLRSGRTIKYEPIKVTRRIGKSKIRIIKDGAEFLMIITKIGMTFSPLRVFVPISSFLFFLGFFRYIYTYIVAGQFTNMSHLLINSSVIVFMLGLIAEQIASLRLERKDALFDVDAPTRYEKFARLSESDSQKKTIKKNGRFKK